MIAPLQDAVDLGDATDAEVGGAPEKLEAVSGCREPYRSYPARPQVAFAAELAGRLGTCDVSLLFPILRYRVGGNTIPSKLLE